MLIHVLYCFSDPADGAISLWSCERPTKAFYLGVLCYLDVSAEAQARRTTVAPLLAGYKMLRQRRHVQRGESLPSPRP